jgi:excisionase family DNA binding protein
MIKSTSLPPWEPLALSIDEASKLSNKQSELCEPISEDLAVRKCGRERPSQNQREGRKTEPAEDDRTARRTGSSSSTPSRQRASDARAERELPRLCYTIKEVCRITGLGKTTIYAAFKSGALVKTKIGNSTRVLDEDLKAFLRNSRKPEK